jgi:hypothetical protein
VYLFLLPFSSVGLAQSIYVDENALIPGMAATTMSDHHFQALKNYERDLRALGQSDARRCDSPLVANFLLTTFQQQGLEAFQYFPNANDSTTVIVWGILRAPRADGKESLALVSHINPSGLCS